MGGGGGATSGGDPAVLFPQSGNLNFVGELSLKFFKDIFDGLLGDFGPFFFSDRDENRSPFAIDFLAERSRLPVLSLSSLSSVLSKRYAGSVSVTGELFSGINRSSSAQSLLSCRL